MNNKRPVNLDLMTVRFPITAVASILHRISAVITWVGLGYLLFFLGQALVSETQFNETANLLQTNVFLQFLNWGFLTAFGYYCMATIKHIIQDIGFFEDLSGGKFISWAAIILGILLAILAGVFVWA